MPLRQLLDGFIEVDLHPRGDAWQDLADWTVDAQSFAMILVSFLWVYRRLPILRNGSQSVRVDSIDCWQIV